MSNRKLSKAEVEELGYYDFMAYVGVSYIHFGGMKATKQLAELCRVSPDSTVLIVGCGTGYSACYLAQEFSCRVIGLDVAPTMIMKAVERAKDWGLEDRVEFVIGDAHKLPFVDITFDVVLSEFVTFLLNDRIVFREYYRVLKPSGYLGLNELFCAEQTSAEIREEIDQAIDTFSEVMERPIHIKSPEAWVRLFVKTGFHDVHTEKVTSTYSYREYIRSLGGITKMLLIIFRVLYWMARSKKLRERYMRAGTIKNIFVQSKRTREYVGGLLCVGKR